MSTTFNPADIAFDARISNNNLTITTDANGTYCGGRTTASASASVIYYCEFENTGLDPGYGTQVGLANGTWNLYGSVGDTNNGCGLETKGGTVYLNSVSQGTITGATAGDVNGMAYNATANRIYFNINGGAYHNSGNPVAGTGGTSLSGVLTGTRYPAASNGNLAGIITLISPATAWRYTPPTGAVEFGTVDPPRNRAIIIAKPIVVPDRRIIVPGHSFKEGREDETGAFLLGRGGFPSRRVSDRMQHAERFSH